MSEKYNLEVARDGIREVKKIIEGYCRNCGMNIRRQKLKLMCACGFTFCSVKCNKEYHLRNGGIY